MDTNVTASLAMAQCCLPHLTASKVLPSVSRAAAPGTYRLQIGAGKHRLYIIHCRIHAIRGTRNVIPPPRTLNAPPYVALAVALQRLRQKSFARAM